MGMNVMAGIASSLESRQVPGLVVAEAGSAGAGKGLASLFDATLSGLMPSLAPHDDAPPELPAAVSAAVLPSQPATTPDPAAAVTSTPVLTATAMPAAPAVVPAPTADLVTLPAPEPRAVLLPEPAVRPAGQLAQQPVMPAATLSARMTAAVPAGAARPVRMVDAKIASEDLVTADAAGPDNPLPQPVGMPMTPPLTPAMLPPSPLPTDVAASAAPAMPRAALADSIAAASRNTRTDAVEPAPAMSQPAASPQALKPSVTVVTADAMAAGTASSEPSFARAFANASAVVAPAAPRLAEKPAVVSVAATPADASAQIIPSQSVELPRLAVSASQPPVALAHTPLQDPAWAQAAGQRLAWMVQGGESTAVLAINPESLGPIHVRIHMDGQGARIDLAAQQPMTATLLESHLPRLTAALENQGVRVDELRVGNQALAGDFAAWQGASGGSGQQAAAGEQGARQSRWVATSASADTGRMPGADVSAAAIARQASDDGRVDDFA